jgi:hypothetical protein
LSGSFFRLKHNAILQSQHVKLSFASTGRQCGLRMKLGADLSNLPTKKISKRKVAVTVREKGLPKIRCKHYLNVSHALSPTRKQLLKNAAVSFCFLALSHTPAALAVKKGAATTVATVEHLHTGQKVANFFRSFGLPDVAVLAIISALPVVELRGAIPVGIWMGLPITTVLPACVLGNMMPIVPLLFLLRNDRLK